MIQYLFLSIQIYVIIQCSTSFHIAHRPSSSIAQSTFLRKRRLPPLHSENNWLPQEYGDKSIEEYCIKLVSTSIQNKLNGGISGSGWKNTRVLNYTKGKFIDCVYNIHNNDNYNPHIKATNGENVLENLILSINFPLAVVGGEEEYYDHILKGSILALQSLCVLGMQVGVTGGPIQQEKRLSHLSSITTSSLECKSTSLQNRKTIQKLKYTRKSTNAGFDILAYLKKKRTSQGAYDLLCALDVWDKHEDLALLCSGYPTRFTDDEEELANMEDEGEDIDIDTVLNLRQDFRCKMKVYTIDNASTNEVDDGISIEVYTDEQTGDLRKRYWVHIADADRWAPRGSDFLEIAKRRSTSLYIPTGSLPMFPYRISVNKMSLKAKSLALSLGVELNSDGSIIPSSIIVTTSLIHVSYRLTYDDVDEMLDEGVGYNEEWQLGSLLSAAKLRRIYRTNKGSMESLIKNPIPQGSISVQSDPNGEDGYSITLNVDVSHNSGVNHTDTALSTDYAAPASNANLIVTEMMILAGEALGAWGLTQNTPQLNQEIQKYNTNHTHKLLEYELRLPYRSQKNPEFQTRERDAKIFELLSKHHKGEGYCAAWFSRRLFPPVTISEDPMPHFGLGLDCYVQWSSPIRRLGDLQVHAMIKRYLRRRRVNDLIKEGRDVPQEITAMDLGCYLNATTSEELSINLKQGLGLFRAARPLQRASQKYWMLEYIRRCHNDQTMECVVLGCTDYERNQYAIYIPMLGLEHKYLSEMGSLKDGQRIWLKVASVNPRMLYLTLTLGQKSRVVSPAA